MMNNMITRKDMIAAVLGIIGFAGIFFAFSFKLNGIIYSIEWSIVFPLIALLSFGRRGALIACFGGFFGLYTFFIYDGRGLENWIAFIATAFFFYIHGWAAEKRQHGSRMIRHNFMAIQGMYAIVILPLYLLGFRLLSPGAYSDQVVLIFALKWLVNGLVSLALAESLITLPILRRFLGLRVDDSYSKNLTSMVSVVLSGIGFIIMMALAETYLLGWSESILDLKHPPSEIIFIGWLILVFLIILGGHMAGLIQTKRAKDMLILEERDSYRNIFENIEDIYYESDVNGVILEISPSIERVLGFKRENIIGTYGRVDEILMSKLNKNGFLQHELIDLMDIWGNNRVISVNARLVKDTTGIFKVIGVFRDMTELEASRMELIRMNHELEERVKVRTTKLEVAVKELEDFSHIVSHDLKSPVRSIDSYCQYIIEDYGADMPLEIRNMVSSIRVICGDMIHLIEGLLEYAVTSKINIEPVAFDSGEIIKAVISEMEGIIIGRYITLDVDKSFPMIWGDPMLFRQIVSNGLSNALKFTRGRHKSVIRITSALDGDMAHFAISDNGIGFELDNVDSLFDIFKKMHMPDEYEGAGVGLATVRKSAERQGGASWITGEPDIGATLHVTLPRLQREELNDGQGH